MDVDKRQNLNIKIMKNTVKKSKILKKLHSRKGETLVEVMVAILVGVFSCLMLAQIISTSTDLDSTSRVLFTEYYKVNNQLTKAYAGDENSGLVPKIGNIIITGDNVEVDIVYQSEYYVNGTISGAEVIAYRKAD